VTVYATRFKTPLIFSSPTTRRSRHITSGAVMPISARWKAGVRA